MYLITETIDNPLRVLSEEKEGRKNLFIEGVFMQAEQQNKNGRIYPRDILINEVARYNQAYIKENRALGELGHPDGPTVNLDRVSHKIVSLTREGNNFRGKAKLLETPMGKIAKALINEGVKLGVSSRGVGTLQVTREGHKLVNDDFMLATAADIVADPSAPDAFVEGIMEGKEWIWDGNLLREKKATKMRTRINTLVDQRKLEESKLHLFNEFLSNL